MDDLYVKSGDRLKVRSDGPIKLHFLAEQMAEPVLLFASKGPACARIHLPHFHGDAAVSATHSASTTCEIQHQSLHAAEHPDPVPIEVPLLDREETYEDIIRRVIRNELSRAAEDSAGSFEEEDDFEVDDEFEPWDIPTRYELGEQELEASPEAPEQAPQEKPEDPPDPQPTAETQAPE